LIVQLGPIAYRKWGFRGTLHHKERNMSNELRELTEVTELTDAELDVVSGGFAIVFVHNTYNTGITALGGTSGVTAGQINGSLVVGVGKVIVF
jgi:hypothetical protein